ncbi:MAG: transposase [Aestuariibacter sp.]|nr:transposase [Aestuariibacter sp.]
MERAIQTLFTQHFEAYSHSHKLSVRELDAARSFIACRTAELGGHIETCPEGHIKRAHYNSCKHRSCAQCNAIQIERWLQKQKSRLLQCPHHHIIFTIAHELIPLWQFNRSAVMNLLFKAIRKTLLDFLDDPRCLGATPGILCAFHSWGRDLCKHLHGHCLVTDGGLNSEGEWLTPKRSYFLPIKAVMLKFRGTFCGLLHQALDAGDIDAPTQDTIGKWHGIIKKTQRKKWNVNLRERYDHGQGVATYLARYVRGGPVSDHQMTLSQGSIRFRYYEHRKNSNGKKQHPSYLTLKPDQFFKRYLQHIPEKRKQVVRAWGLYATAKQSGLNQARAHHQQNPVEPIENIEWQDFIEGITGEDFRHCPTCQRQLISQLIVPKQQSPPPKRSFTEIVDRLLKKEPEKQC